MELPIYEALIVYDEQGIQKISFVDLPAVEANWVAFNKEEKKVQFEVQDEEQKIVLGVVMRADFPIYRYDQSGEYYIKYSKETIKQMAEKMIADNAQNKINLQHMDGTDVTGVYLRELFIKDIEKGIDPKGFENIEDGSLFATYKVENEELWNAIKEGIFNGFSLEGLFAVRKVENKRNKILNKMNKLNKIVKSFLVRFAEVTTDKGILSYAGEEDIKVGDEVFVEVEGETKPAEDGDYVLEDGTVIVVAEGKVAEIREPEAEEPAVEEAVEETVEEVVEEMAEEEPAEEAAEEAAEEVTEEVTVDEEKEALKEENEALKARIEELEAENLALKEQLAEIVNKPAVEPIVEEFEKATEVESTGNKKLDRMIKRFETLKN